MCKKESKYSFLFFIFFPLKEELLLWLFFKTLACLLLLPPAFSKWELLLIHSQEKSLPPSTVGYFRTIGPLGGSPVTVGMGEQVENLQSDKLFSNPCASTYKTWALKQVPPCFSEPPAHTCLTEAPCTLKTLQSKCPAHGLTL